MSGSFNAVQAGDVMLIRPDETAQYLLSTTGDGIGNVRLERSLNCGQSWQIMLSASDVAINYTGTVAVPLTGTIASGRITNETRKAALYRWNCTSFDLAASAKFDWTMINPIKAALVLANNVCVLLNNEAPVDGVLGDGAGFAGGGSLYIDYVNTTIWFNNGTAATPDWDAFA